MMNTALLLGAVPGAGQQAQLNASGSIPYNCVGIPPRGRSVAVAVHQQHRHLQPGQRLWLRKSSPWACPARASQAATTVRQWSGPSAVCAR